MDVEGARALSKRLAEQAHWEQADSVRAGIAPRKDPDAGSLTEMHEGLRVYGVEAHTRTQDGVVALVERRFCKRLVDGVWERSVDERVELAG